MPRPAAVTSRAGPHDDLQPLSHLLREQLRLSLLAKQQEFLSLLGRAEASDLRSLPLTQWLAACGRYLFSPEPGDSPVPRTYAEVAAWLGVSCEEVRAAEEQVLTALRGLVSQRGESDQ